MSYPTEDRKKILRADENAVLYSHILYHLTELQTKLHNEYVNGNQNLKIFASDELKTLLIKISRPSFAFHQLNFEADNPPQNVLLAAASHIPGVTPIREVQTWFENLSDDLKTHLEKLRELHNSNAAKKDKKEYFVANILTKMTNPSHSMISKYTGIAQSTIRDWTTDRNSSKIRGRPSIKSDETSLDMVASVATEAAVSLANSLNAENK